MDKMKAYRIKYFYADQGMEGRIDSLAAAMILAPSKEMAIYIYEIMNGEYLDISFEQYMKIPIEGREWGMSIKEIPSYEFQYKTQKLKERV